MTVGAASTDARETDALLSSDCSPSPGIHSRCTWPWLHVVIIAMLVGIVSSMGEDLLAAPKIRLIESALCTRYYASHDPSIAANHDGGIPENLCKINTLQDGLAGILGGQFFFDSIPAILFPIPYGLLADRYGRKWLLVASCTGVTLSYGWILLTVGVLNLPLHYVWFSSVFSLLGGGPTVATYILTTMVADVVPPDLRSTVFFYRFCTDLIADLTIPPLTWYLMFVNLWIPPIGAVVLQALTCLICCVLPETAPWQSTTHGAEGTSSDSRTGTDSASPMKHCSPSRTSKLKDSFSFLTSNRPVKALIFSFLLSKIGRQSSNVLLQYVSKRYDWSLSQAELLISLKAAVNIFLFTIILPTIAAFLLARVGTSAARDLLLARGSVSLLLLGAIVLALSATPLLMIIGLTFFTLGTGLPHATRSLITSIVEFHNSDEPTSDIARLYALISVAEGIGSLVAALAMSWMLRFGLLLGPAWLGLPFALSAALFALVALVVFGINTSICRI